MLLVVGAGLIGLTLAILLALIVVSQLSGGRWPADAVVAERVTSAGASPYARGGLARAARRSRQRST